MNRPLRLRWLLPAMGGAGAAAGIAARRGRGRLAGTMAAECTLAVIALARGAARFRVPAIGLHDGAGVGYHIDAPVLFGLGAHHTGPGRRVVDGAVLVDYGPLGEHHNPAYTAWRALACCNRYVETACPDDREAALASVRALLCRVEPYATADSDVCGAVWTYDVDWPVFGSVLRALWISAMAQGLAMSALVRAYRLSGDPVYLDIARAAAAPFEQPTAAGGLRHDLGGRAYYEEYPVPGGSLVLDGSLFGLLGLYDLWTATRNAGIRRLFEDGVEGIAANLPVWDFFGLWSRYGRSGQLCTPEYHQLNSALIEVVGRLSGRAELRDLAARWAPDRSGCLRRLAVYTAFTAALYRAGVRERLSSLTRSIQGRAGLHPPASPLPILGEGEKPCPSQDWGRGRG